MRVRKRKTECDYFLKERGMLWLETDAVVSLRAVTKLCLDCFRFVLCYGLRLTSKWLERFPLASCILVRLHTTTIGCPKTHFFSTNSRSSGQLKNDAKTLFPHPPSPFSGNFFPIATVVAFVLLRNSRFNFHFSTQHEATPTQKSVRKWRWDLSRLLARKITKGIHSCKPHSLNRPTEKHAWVLKGDLTMYFSLWSP